MLMHNEVTFVPNHALQAQYGGEQHVETRVA